MRGLEEYNYVEVFKDFQYTDLEIKIFIEFLQTYEEYIPKEWELEDIAHAVVIFSNAEQAFWFMEEGNDFSAIASYLASYPLSRVNSNQLSLAQHLIEEHEHFYTTKNGYVFFAD